MYPCRFSLDRESPCIDPRTSRNKSGMKSGSLGVGTSPGVQIFM